jgi:peptidoglycan hydrolase CwlO-like protein
MKIIIIILICLFFSLTITPINEFLTNPTPVQPTTTGPASETQTVGPPAQIQTAGPSPAKSQAQPESGLQTQVNMLSTQITTTNAIAVEAKNKVDEISSEIKKLKDELKKAPEI